jgi:hypothetical protein
MPGAQKKGNYWYWYWDYNGERITSSDFGVKYETEKDALRELEIVKGSIIRSNYLFGDPKMTVGELFIAY